MKLPSLTTKRLAVKVKPAAERALRQGHPWIFEEAITKISPDAHAGDLAIIYDNKKNKFLALGLYDPHSVIRIKVIQFIQPATINADWFLDKLSAAKAKRDPLLTTDTNAYRFVFGENDGLPGMIVDVYDQCAVLKLYSVIWLPYLEVILPILIELTKVETVVLRLSRLLQKKEVELHGLKEGMKLHGTLSNAEIIFKEHGVLFSANVIKGHKTGFFLDHRHNRKKIGALSSDKKVLDVFSYAGGFSIHALAGGASEVVSLEISAPALALARANAQLNEYPGKHRCLAMDAFEGLAQLKQEGERFDIIIIDPPSFAKQASEVPQAIKSYERLAAAGLGLLKPGGLLVLASCSSRITKEQFFETVEAVLLTETNSFRVIEKTGHDLDHPVGFPQGSYLKTGYYEIG